MTIQIASEHCTGCSYCVVTCPAEAIRLDIAVSAAPRIDDNLCTRCSECLYTCPNNVFSDPTLDTAPVELDKEYDALVIGAGIGGLMTAAGLAKAGKKVLVLEQLSFIGGKYTQLPFHDYAISTAAWTCPGPNSRIGKLCTKLGAGIKWVTVHDVKSQGDHWVVTKDGRRFNNLDEAQAAVVGGPKEMYRVHSWIADMYNPNIHYPEDMTTRQYIRKFFPNHPEHEMYVQTIITYCFASQTVDNFSAMETKHAIVDSIEQMADWGTAVGGTSAIVDSLEKVIMQFNGKIALRTKVASIDIVNGKAVGVTLQDGRTIHANVVVHNAGLNRMVKLVGEDRLPKDYLTRLKGAIPANVAALILGTNEPLLGTEHSLLHTMGWEPTLNCYAPTFFDPKLAPAGKHALDVFWVMQSPFDLRKELDQVLAQLRAVFPGFDQKVEMQNPMFFTGPWTAEMAHRIGQSGKDRLDPQTPIQNLYMVGYDCIGYGMAGDIIPHGVERALYLILQDPTYLPVDEKGSAKINKWVKSQVLKFMAWQGKLKAKKL